MYLEDYLFNKPVIETGILILRPFRMSDVESLKEWMADKYIYDYWGKKPGKADKDPSLLFHKSERPSKSFHLGIEHREDGKVIGEIWVYLIENSRMAKVAIRISPAYHGKGLGTEALKAMVDFCFNHTELQRLWTDVDVRNTASVKMLEKCGFLREGLIRQGKMVSSWCDYYIYGLLKTDREENKSFCKK